MINPLLIAVAMLSGSPALGQALFPLDESQQGELLPDPYDDTSSFRSDSKIVGGETASRGAWLWQVAVYRRVMKNGTPVSKGWLFCGGSLIHPRWVLTAAHCLEPEPAGRYDAAAPGDLVVVEGTSVLAHSVFGGGRENGRKLRASRVVMHEQWNARSVENDIALIELASPATSKPIAIAFGTARPDTKADKLQDGTFDAAGNMAIVTGWGRLRFSEPNRPARLMQVRVPLVPVETCKRANESLRGTIDHRNICAGEPAGGRDSCAGDSGGPMVVPNPDTGYVQVGIVSWGTPNGCGAPGFYGVYTRVSAFGDWVSAKTGIASPRERPAVASLPPRPGPKIAPGDRALLVGVGHYQDAKIALKGSANDVRNIERLLVGTFGYQSEQIMKLLDGDATRANILAAFEEWLIHESAPGARIFFYVSSHGAQVPDLNGDEEDGLDETIAPYDTRVEIQNGRKVLRNQIIDDEIDELLKRIADRTVTVVIDSCHSGTATRGDAARFELGTVKCLCAVLDDYDPRAAVMAAAGTRSVVFRGGSRRAAPGPKQGFIERRDNVVAWSAVNEGELALVDSESAEPESVFTRRFIDGISLGVFGDDGRISHAKLLEHVRAESAAYCSRHKDKCEAGLSPQLEARRDMLAADVVTGRAPEKPEDVPQSALVHGNTAGLAVDFVQGAQLKVGQSAQVRVTTQKTGYLVLLDVAADGKVTQVFPNALSLSSPTGGRKGSNLVAPGRPLLVPNPKNPYEHFTWEIEAPTGEGRLIAILSKDPLRSVSVPERPTTLDTSASGDLVARIAYELLREPMIAGRVQRREWSLVQTPYRINQ